MDPAYAPWIALACGIIGMLIGYFMGYRTGRIAGELAILKSSRPRRERARKSNRTAKLAGPEPALDDLDDIELDAEPSHHQPQ